MTFKSRLSLIIFPLIYLSIGGFANLLTPAFGDAPYVTYSNVGMGYGNGFNTVAFRNNAIYTVGNYQFVSYYMYNTTTPYVVVARRDINTNSWTNVTTSYLPDSLTDDHDVIAFGIDGDGIMHMSWGMHNGSTLHYATSTASVLGSTFAPTFSTTAITIPNTYSTEYGNSTTYPEFYNLSNGGLMFTYRTGYSGDGDAMYSLYNPTTHTWSANPIKLIDGTTGSYNSNAYTNSMVFDSQGRVQLSWVYRETADFQSNHDIMYAYATNQTLTTWKQMSGSTQTVPITQGNDATIKTIAQGSSLINQCSMAVDANDRPLIATYWAPDGNTRQYELVWYNGTSWLSSQISNRPYEAKITDNDAVKIRYMGRPIVMVDPDGRVLVITRCDNTGSTVSSADNHVTAYYSTNRTTWTSIDLTTADSGRYEPIYDEVRWSRDHILSLYYEPSFATSSGAPSQGAQQVSVLEWNSLRYMRGAITVNWAGGNSVWSTASNWTNNVYAPDGKWTTVSFANLSNADEVVDMSTTGRTVGNISFTSSAHSTTIQGSGVSLILDNSGSDSAISVTGSHTISTPVLLNNDVDVSGAGTLNLSGGISGSHMLDVLSGNLTAKNILVDTLTIGSGATVTIQAIPGGPLSGEIMPVPEPSMFALLAIGALFAAGYGWRRRLL
jgi:hypothetical protein